MEINMNRHAYLIIAHHQFSLLEKIIRLLDNERNDIYIHIDKKVEGFDEQPFYEAVKYSNIYFVKRISVSWGGFSQIKCELELLRSAVKGNYQYYHLISGVDLPLKKQNEIFDFFDKNNGCEFVQYGTKTVGSDILDRIKFYYPLQEYYASKGETTRFIADKLLNLQRRLKINRIRTSSLTIQKGPQWFSITDKLAQYVLSCEKQIYSLFRYSYCCDEVFMQTLVVNSEFKRNLYLKDKNDSYLGCMRYIDWERGCPYIFRKSDYDQLVNSPFLFARKFDVGVDSEIIDRLFNTLVEKEN